MLQIGVDDVQTAVDAGAVALRSHLERFHGRWHGGIMTGRHLLEGLKPVNSLLLHNWDQLDPLDARIVELLEAEPRIGVLEMSRRLAVARGTVQARLDRLVRRGVIASFAPTLDPEALGYGVTAFATVEIRQGSCAVVLGHLRGTPEVLEVHTITGQGDLLCRVVARSNADLQQVLDRVTQFPEIVRTSTVIALSNPISHRVLPLVTPDQS